MKKFLFGLLTLVLLSSVCLGGWDGTTVTKMRVFNTQVNGTTAAAATTFTIPTWDAYGIVVRARGERINFAVAMGTNQTPEVSAYYSINTSEVYTSPAIAYLPVGRVFYFWRPYELATAEVLYWTK